MTHRFSLALTFVLSAVAVATTACSSAPAESEETGSTTAHVLAKRKPQKNCSQFGDRQAVGPMVLSDAGAHTQALAIPVDQSTTASVKLTFHTIGTPASEFTLRLNGGQGQQIGAIVTSVNGLAQLDLLSSAYPKTDVFYVQVTLTNPGGVAREEIFLARDNYTRVACTSSSSSSSSSGSNNEPVVDAEQPSNEAAACSCQGVDVYGHTVGGTLCGAEVIGTDGQVWTCTTDGFQPANRAGSCSCDGIASDGQPVHSDTCASTVCGTDHKVWTCGPDNYQRAAGNDADCE
jgi:hypothetical protein